MHAYCDYMAACDPLVIRQLFGDLATCKAREELSCRAMLSPDTGWTSASSKNARRKSKVGTPAASTLSVAEYAVRCRESCPRGLAAPIAGSARVERATSPRLRRALTGLLRAAASVRARRLPPSRAAGTTAPAPCPGTATTPATARSVASSPRAEGAPCTVPVDCEGNLFCKRSTSDAGTSVCTKRGAVGAPCSDAYECDATVGLRCASGVCADPTIVSAGAMCDFAGRACETGTLCGYPYPLPTAPPFPPSTCQPLLDDGSPCASAGPACRPPAFCRLGICRVPGDCG